MKIECAPLPKDWAPTEPFLFRVHGNHLEDAHIVNGDYVLVHPQDTGTAGDIVVTLNGDNATVQHYTAATEHIVGKVRGVLRVGVAVEGES